MFCNKCGKEVPDNTKFCTGCGASTQASQPNVATATAPQPQYQQQAYTPNTGGVNYATYQNAPTAQSSSKKTTVAVATVSAILVIITMLFGWFTFSIPSSVLDAPFQLGDLGYSFTIFQVADVTGQVNTALKAAKQEMLRYSGSSSSNNTQLREVQDVMDKLGMVTFVANLVKILAILALLSLLAFAFMLLIENKNAAMIGQLGFSCTILATIIFMIFMGVLNSNIASLMDRFGAPTSAREMIKLSSSIWVYLTLVFGIIGGAFVTIRKSIIRGY